MPTAIQEQYLPSEQDTSINYPYTTDCSTHSSPSSQSPDTTKDAFTTLELFINATKTQDRTAGH